jgi:hypothetical protein
MLHRRHVQRGIITLDHEMPTWGRPDWLWDIDLTRLNMLDTHDCVLGQLFGSYHSAPRLLLTHEFCCGFAVHCRFPAPEWRYALLTREWRRALRHLQEERAVRWRAAQPFAGLSSLRRGSTAGSSSPGTLATSSAIVEGGGTPKG